MVKKSRLDTIQHAHAEAARVNCLEERVAAEEDRDTKAGLFNGNVAGRLHRRAERRDRLVGADEELHRFHNRQTQELDVHLCGRRLYEEMAPWEAAGEKPSAPRARARVRPHLEGPDEDRLLDDAREVKGNARLAGGDVVAEVARLKQQPGRDMAVGGAGLASSLIKLDLIDEYRLFVSPVVLGGGTPYFPAMDERLSLELVETQTFGSRTVYVRYKRRRVTLRPA